ncbi:hypothetical protein [Flavobacterium daemonense]|uniref:hypothetical protein n=1 Tax=Flavobacterium daemonense TaxID=1393049 RepID=UPI001186E58D|nr:hypothetical protein [Flavobacterium daemonense]KAF2328587.1 hypothetical protein FND99_17535 [Flavobacterium daemonense]
MKRLFLLTVLFFNIVAYSQDMLEVVAKETCSCLEAKKAKRPNMSTEDFKVEVGVCMVKSYSDHLTEFKVEDRVTFDDKDGMTKLGENVAIKMLQFCPNIILELGRSAIKEKKEVKRENLSVSGEVTDIKWEQFVTLQLKDKNGRNYSFLMLDAFDSASLLTNDEIKKKDKLKVSYTEIELFDSKAKEFRYFKILTKLERQ